MKQFLKYILATVVGLIIFSIISSLFFVLMVFMMIPKSEPIKENSVLQFQLNGTIIDRSKTDIYSLLDKTEMTAIGLDDLLTAIRAAKSNPKVKGIYLNPGMTFRAGFSTLTELREALIDFKKSGKFVIAYSGAYTQSGYYLSTAADVVMLNKQGVLDFRGISASSLFVKNLLDKIGVDMQIIKVGSYKSATEMFTNEKMSNENREQMTLLTNTIWNNVLRDISKSRKISEDSLTAAADQLLTFRSPERAVSLQMVDSLMYWDQVEATIKKYLGLAKNDKISFIKPIDLIDPSLNLPLKAKNKIAIVYAVGDIDNGTTDGIQSSKLISTLKDVEDDASIKSVVFRINSPGGSAYGSEQIWRAISKLKEAKPVIVSMGDYAASGGYYISCNATKIVADPNTITGSIGIFGVIPNTEKLMDKLGLSYDVVKTNPYADMPNIYRALTEDEKNIMQHYVNAGYELFVNRCAEGRGMSAEAIKKIAEGHVWSGTQALENGLVDTLGTFQDAIKIAANAANLKDYQTEEFPKKESWFSQFRDLSGGRFESAVLGTQFSRERELLNKIQQMDNFQATIPLDIKVE